MILYFADQKTLGLWLLVSQLTTFLTALDAGLSSSSVRQFVGAASANDPGRLAPRFQSTLLISTFQGLLIILIGLAGADFAGHVLAVPIDLRNQFVLLLAAQSVLIGLTFPLRPFSSILLAAQRFGLNYIGNAALLFVAVLTGWLGFVLGLGIWGLFAGNVLVGIGQFFLAVTGVARMGFLPKLFKQWEIRRPDLVKIAKESLEFASGSFFGALSGLLQSTILSRLFGLEGVATWNVGAKIVTVLSQLLSKFFESSFG